MLSPASGQSDERQQEEQQEQEQQEQEQQEAAEEEEEMELVAELVAEPVELQVLHSADRRHGCSVCHLRFSTSSALKCHEKVHEEKDTIVCVLCGQAFNSMPQLNIHILNVHREAEAKAGDRHHCEQCDKYFTTRRTLQQHQAARHSREGLLACEMPDCGARFATASCLRKHIQRVHLRLRPHPCPVCGKRFNDANGLTGHLRIHSGERPYQCSHCSKRFAESTTLKKHLLTHTGERPHACRICDKRFSQIGHLQTHMKIHTGVKEFKCDKCSKTFRTTSARKVHMLSSHSHDRPYRCDTCNRGFISACKLREHMLLRHRERLHPDSLSVA